MYYELYEWYYDSTEKGKEMHEHSLNNDDYFDDY